MKERKKLVWIKEDDLRLAKSIASIKGQTIGDYLGDKVREDTDCLKNPLLPVTDKRKKKNGLFPL